VDELEVVPEEPKLLKFSLENVRMPIPTLFINEAALLSLTQIKSKTRTKRSN
jgi:hypothetical protein